MTFNEYLEIASREQKNKLEGDEGIRKLLNTPMIDLNLKYRNLIPNFGVVGDENLLRNTLKGKMTLGDIIEENLDTQSLNNSFNYWGDFEDEFEEGVDDYVEAYFVHKDDSKDPCGFIAYNKGDGSSKIIRSIILFSFNLSGKDFGKQIWIDLEKDLQKKIEEGYSVRWRSKKENSACKNYEYFIHKFKGEKVSNGDYWDYFIGEEGC